MCDMIKRSTCELTKDHINVECMLLLNSVNYMSVDLYVKSRAWWKCRLHTAVPQLLCLLVRIVAMSLVCVVAP